jgi:hypothetical protein
MTQILADAHGLTSRLIAEKQYRRKHKYRTNNSSHINVLYRQEEASACPKEDLTRREVATHKLSKSQ